MKRPMEFARFAAQFLQGLIDLPENGMGVFLKKETGRGERYALSATL
jgi:hypothetical protein